MDRPPLEARGGTLSCQRMLAFLYKRRPSTILVRGMRHHAVTCISPSLVHL